MKPFTPNVSMLRRSFYFFLKLPDASIRVRAFIRSPIAKALTHLIWQKKVANFFQKVAKKETIFSNIVILALLKM